jgi:ribonuclease E
VQIGRISRFGLLEMSRQRLRPSLGEASQIVCPRCDGHGRMRSVESLALSIIRVAEEHAMKDNTGQVLVQAPVEIANYLLNEKRGALREIEARHDAPIVIVADEQLHTPHYEVTRVRENELGEETSKPSYQRGTPRKLATIALTKANLNVPAAPVVKNVRPAQPAPLREPRPEPAQAAAPVPAPAFAAKPASTGFMGWLKGLLGGGETAAPRAGSPEPRERGERKERNGQRRDERGNRQGGNRDRNNRRDERGNRQGGQQQAQAAQKRQDNKPAQQPKPPKPERQKQEAPQQAKADDAQRQPPKTSRKPRDEATQTGRKDEAAENAAMIATAPMVDPAAEAVQSVAEADKVVQAPEQANDTGNAEGASRRRRGRRGGRRRRNKQGAEGASGESGIEAMDAGEAVIAPLQSQPEFDFADTRLALPSVVPTGKGPLEVTDADSPMRAQAPSPSPAGHGEPQVVQPAADAAPKPMPESIPAPFAAPAVESVVVAAPESPAPAVVAEATPAPSPLARTPASFATEPSPAIAGAHVEPAVQADDDASAVAAIASAAEPDADATAEAESKDSREESPLA